MKPQDAIVDLQDQILSLFFGTVQQNGISPVRRAEVEERCTEEILQSGLDDPLQLLDRFHAAGKSVFYIVAEVIIVHNI